MSPQTFLAFDLGAESGRAILGTLDGDRLSLEALARFPNLPLRIHGRWHWNLFRLYEEMITGLIRAVRGSSRPIRSLGIDTWGVDFGFLGRDGALLGLPRAYRDPHTEGTIQSFCRRVPRRRIYELTGIQFLPFNSLFQLHALKRDGSSILEAAEDLLFMPDLLNYLFTGKKKTEFTMATTSQLYDPNRGRWAEELFAALEVPFDLMQTVVPPASVLGDLEENTVRLTGLDPLPVIAVASHDTASAVAAAPAEGEDWAYISSGTWSLMGIETRAPILTGKAEALNFTNEGGLDGTFRFLKNITGLWLLQECRRTWSGDRPLAYEELILSAEEAEPFRSLVDPDWPRFLNPPDMTAAIASFCRKTGQPAPESVPQYVRCILESLALKYRIVLDQIRSVHSQAINRIHIIGGGARNGVLNRFTADATGLRVVAGPAEATAAGNILVQALAAGSVRSHAHLRRIVRESDPPDIWEPGQPEIWESALAGFRDLVAASGGLDSY